MSIDWKHLYPFTSHFLQLGADRLHYIDEGEGQPLLMVHGNPTWSFYWRNLAVEFRTRYRVVVPDHIGCGFSDKPQDYDYCLSQHIENLVGLIEDLDLHSLTLLVHDWGGAIGLGAALRVPERVSRLIVFNTGAFPPPYVPWRIRACRIPLLGTFAVRGLNLFARAALFMAVQRPASLSPPTRAGLLAPYGNWHDRIGIQRFVADIPTKREQPTWQLLEQIERGLPTLADRPVQMIWGMRDWCFRPECLERLHQAFPRAEIHRLPEVGHYVVEEGITTISPLVERFLSEHVVL
jgi:haloalkane dehalogenase